MRLLVKTGLLFVISLALNARVKGDSPITSTYFCEPYMSIGIVKYAADKKVLDKKIAKYLLKSTNPIDIKAAVANALGWDFDGKKNSDLFLGFLEKKYGKKISDPLNNPMDGQEQIILGYLKALDNYFEPALALPWVNGAVQKMPNSFTVNMLAALVKAQVSFDTDWCEVWKVVEAVNLNPSLTRDLKKESVDIIMEYINLYKEDCKK